MKNYITIITLSTAFFVASCAQPGAGPGAGGINKAQAGTVLGGIGGGIIGSNIGKGKGNTAATIGGAILGGMAGNSVGTSLDSADTNAYNQQNFGNPQNANSIQNALENARTGETYNWAEPNGAAGTITPTGTFNNQYGQVCRNYNKTDYYGNNTSGTACRSNNGTWQ